MTVADSGIKQHIHEGEFIAKFPLIPGHETVGVVAAKGKVRYLVIMRSFWDVVLTGLPECSRL